MEERKPRLEIFRVLLTFLKGDNRVPDAFSWGFSLDTKLTAIGLSYQEALEQLPKCFDEIKEIEKQGHGSGIECFKLGMKYEFFLHSIYALCENLGKIVSYLYPSRNLSPHFRRQKSRFLKDLKIDPDYSKLLAATTWYDEVNALRSEATHYLSGLITISSPSELGYFNVPKSQREGAFKEISIKDVEKHIKQIHDDVLAFL